ncbi:ROK family protein [Tuwongella immobilis]|uniref:ROK family protein n=1 Tax=Tuwongella immobilis TaxID=692036 RepID=A0A6C2YRE8_9BACT|nr:ROK family protein [Tuwongella immobilis]VIP04066.1 Transcriptional regulator/sugar kinase OS=Singulisphaera acidiphila (strain ATCC BAA-1392 / DSM 18658 / VKM B-2454 / MOB10) GN=Sinac_1796 PE=4 SV=1: ROK [Tuwongella immobilis]VTS05499.1 Transcriptional regulator/sugar kinase OS=Singulisphaera acidiphila (strain ATCC BAA-1392 / DSM 18658 / VKM B-2454 / MOB10) GN=Sinac_1796 PE=4 SV=1: ROK [Tuwongella immobilis]
MASESRDGYWLGVDLGGTKILAGLFDSNLKLIARTKQATAADQGGDAVVSRISRAVEEVIENGRIERSEIRGLALGVPGQIEPKTRIVRYAPNLAWRDFAVLPALPETWHWPIYLENDVRMGTYGEYACGVAKGSDNVLGIFAGTGVGGCLILNGKLHTGFLGHGGEIGHLIIHYRKGHSLEGIAGRKSLMKRIGDLLADSPKRVRKEWKNIDLASVKSSLLAEFYQKDDPIAVTIIDEAAKALGAAVGGCINLLSPEVIVIGGGVAGALGESYLERIREIAMRYVLPGAADGVRIVPASLGDDAGIVGCAAYAQANVAAGLPGQRVKP